MILKNFKYKSAAILLIMILAISIIVGAVTVTYAEGTTNAGTMYQGHANGMDICEQISTPSANAGTGITILTHGQNSKAANWSNNGAGGLVYDSDSMIERLRAANANSSVYVARGNGAGDIDRKLIPLSEASDEGYSSYSNDKFADSLSVDKLYTINSHVIIVIDQSDNISGKSHDVAYGALHDFVDDIIYDYQQCTGSVPKINLIGHSRGGILNMMYADEHPMIIDEIFSLGTPYQGSAIGSFANKLVEVKKEITIKTIDCDSARDIIDPVKQEMLLNRWNRTRVANPNIKVHALGSIMDMSVVRENMTLLNKGLTDKLPIPEKTLKSILNLLCDHPDFAKDLMVTKVTNLLAEAFAWNNASKEDKAVLSDLLSEVLDSYIRNVNLEESLRYGRINNVVNLSSLLGRNKVLGYPRGVYLDDGLVQIDSQVGKDFEGFNRYIKLYSVDYEHKDKLSIGKFLAGHNYEPRDPELINYVLANINMESAVNQDFLYEDFGVGIKINGIKNKTFSGTLTIPASIDEKPVIEIGKDALSSRFGANLDAITIVHIPASITYIAENAIVLPNLRSINVDSDNAHFMAVDGNLLSKNGKEFYLYPSKADRTVYTLPSSVEYIAYAAFANATNLISVDLNRVERLAPRAFVDCTTINNIVGNNLINIGSCAISDTQYFADLSARFNMLGSVLIKYNGTDAALDETSFPANMTEIASYAFKGTQVESIVLPNYIIRTNSYAFADMPNLKYIRFNDNIVSIQNSTLSNNPLLKTVDVNLNNLSIFDATFIVACGENFKIGVPFNQIEILKQSDALIHYQDRVIAYSHKITFDSVGGESLSPQNFAYGQAMTLLPTPTRQNYDFAGWYDQPTGGKNYTKLTVFEDRKDFRLYARWDVRVFNIEYELNGGTMTGNPTTYKYGVGAQINNPVRANYVFQGWSFMSDLSGELAVNISNTQSGNVKLYAKWGQICILTLSAKNADPAYETSIRYILGDIMSLSDYRPSRFGHEFLGWTLDGVIINSISQNLAGDNTVIAKWTEYVEMYAENTVSVSAANTRLYIGVASVMNVQSTSVNLYIGLGMTTNARIILLSRNAPINIYIEDFIFMANTYYTFIDASRCSDKVNLVIKGKVSLLGGQKTSSSYYPVIEAQKLNITSYNNVKYPSAIEVIAGDVGYEHKKGWTGTDAIIATTSFTTSNITLKIIGGAGGDGGAGLSGYNGINNYAPASCIEPITVGGKANNGGYGGDGGYGIKSASIIIRNGVNGYIYAGRGGNGGNGGKGGSGGAGWKGISSEKSIWATQGFYGSNGGNGGNGGSGGIGGLATSKNAIVDPAVTLINGAQGVGGNGGQGGAGGRGGAGGDDKYGWTDKNDCHCGGVGGTGGAGGAGGAGSTVGTTGSAGANGSAGAYGSPGAGGSPLNCEKGQHL